MANWYNLKRKSPYRWELPAPTKRVCASSPFVKTDDSGDMFQRKGIPWVIIDEIFSMSGIGGMARLISKLYKEHFDHVREVKVSQYISNYKMIDGGIFHGFYTNSKFYDVAIKFDNLDVVQWGFDHNLFTTKKKKMDMIETACSSGSLSILEWALTKGILKREIIAQIVCYGETVVAGRLDVLKWAHAHGLYLDYNTVLSYSIYASQIAILEWLVSMGYIWDKFFMLVDREINEYPLSFAIGCGKVHVVKWMIDKHLETYVADDPVFGEDWAGQYCEKAAIQGNLDILMLLREKGFPWGTRTMEFAIKNGYDEIVQWCMSNGCPV